MDVKSPSPAPNMLSISFIRRSRLFSIRRLVLAISITLTLFYFHSTFSSSIPFPGAASQPLQRKDASANAEQQPLYYPSPEQQSPVEHPAPLSGHTNEKVSLEAHIMSKCPDARDCLRELVVPAMSEIASLVDFRLLYIGNVSTEDDTVTCMHGPKECLGNSISLCAQELYANNSKISLGFTNCLINDYKHVPEKELVQECALEHAVDFQRLNKCISEDGHGEELLRKSVLQSKEDGVRYSCTVRLQDDIWCVRDGGQWKNCGSHGGSVTALVDEIRKQAGIQDEV